MRLLVTGGAGFIGSNFIRYVLHETTDVRVDNVDALTYAGNLASLTDVADDPRYRFVQGDVCDARLIDELVTQVDAIVHFAAESHVDRSIDGPAAFLRTNVEGSGVVFEAARHHGIERVLHVSTDEVYGSIDAPGAFVEGDPLAPNSPYAASKAAADLLVASYQRTYDFPITITRATNTFGPRHHPEKAIPKFITNLIDGEPIPLYGDGENVRDWLAVGDNVAAQWRVLTEGTPGEIYNIGAGNERTNLQLCHLLMDAFDLDDATRWIERIPDRPGHDRRYAVDASKVRRLGWSPRQGFDEALAETVRWYRNNESWWRPLKEADGSHRRGAPPTST